MTALPLISTARWPHDATGVLPLTSADDPHWAAIVTLAAGEAFTLRAHLRHDVFVLRGSVLDDAGQRLPVDAYASRCEAGGLVAEACGARLFVYREAAATTCAGFTQRAADRMWRDARAPGMRVASVTGLGHMVSLVRWEPGTRTRAHSHLLGEEILVLQGELKSRREAYPAGTWIRLHPGAVHEPHADVPTLILLRNGHLVPRAAAVSP